MEALFQFNLNLSKETSGDANFAKCADDTDNILKFEVKNVLKMLKKTSLGLYIPYEMFLRKDVIFKSIFK